MGIPTVTRKFEIDAGHRLINHPGKCKNYHGHRYVIEPQISAPTMDRKSGMIVDFSLVKELIGGWLDREWDHGMILQDGDELLRWLYGSAEDRAGATSYENPKVYVMDKPPTVENLVREFASHAQSLLKMTPGCESLKIVHVRMYETPNCWADFRPVL